MYNTLDAAKWFAIGAHNGIGQVRKYNGEPYWKHPERVAKTLADHGFGETIQSAAWLHDVVEDVDSVTLEMIEEIFGKHVVYLVEGVTDISTKDDGNRVARKAIDRDHLAKGCGDIHSIKLADLIDNSIDIMKADPNFAVVYMREKKQLLEVLTKGNKELYAVATGIVNDYYSVPEQDNVT